MALIEFKNLPDTSTPLTAENLNNNFEYLDNKFTNSIFSKTERLTEGTAWTAQQVSSITVPKGKYIVVATVIGIPNDAMITITNAEASTICIKGNQFSGRANITDIVSFNSSTTMAISFTNSANFSGISISFTLKAIKISD